MSNTLRQKAILSMGAIGIGTVVMYMGINHVNEENDRRAAGMETVGPTTDMYLAGLLLAAVGILVVALGAHILGRTIGEVLFPQRMDPEEVWEELSPALRHRLRYTIDQGYSRVTVSDGDLHAVLRFGKDQKHLKFVGQTGGVVSISKPLAKYISEAPVPEKPMPAPTVTQSPYKISAPTSN